MLLTDKGIPPMEKWTRGKYHAALIILTFFSLTPCGLLSNFWQACLIGKTILKSRVAERWRETWLSSVCLISSALLVRRSCVAHPPASPRPPTRPGKKNLLCQETHLLSSSPNSLSVCQRISSITAGVRGFSGRWASHHILHLRNVSFHHQNPCSQNLEQHPELELPFTL